MGWMQQVETVALASATFRSVPWGRELLQHLEPQNIVHCLTRTRSTIMFSEKDVRLKEDLENSMHLRYLQLNPCHKIIDVYFEDNINKRTQ